MYRIPVIPEYELLRMVGRGSYGDVWLARGVIGIYRAIKVVWRDRFEDAQPYEQEFTGLRKFAPISLIEDHQLALLHVGRNDPAGFYYYVMELADDVLSAGEINPATYIPHTLKEMSYRRKRVATPEVVSLATHLAQALLGLHKRGLVHQDIKPSNVIFVGGIPKLADIGLVATAVSAEKKFIGTEGFSPPEGPGTPTADVYSLGKLLYEIVTGLDRNDYPRFPADFPELPDRKELLKFNEILIRACDPTPANRYPHALALLKDLLLLQGGGSVRHNRLMGKNRPWLIPVRACLGIIGIVGCGVFYNERQHTRQEEALLRQKQAEIERFERKTTYSAGLRQAQQAIEEGNLEQARIHLQKLASPVFTPPGFEWHLLWTAAQEDPAEIIQNSGAAVEKVKVTPDGRYIAWHSTDKHLTVWDNAEHKTTSDLDEIYNFTGFSSDGKWLIGADEHATFQRWSTKTGALDSGPAPQISRLLSAFDDGTAGVYLSQSEDGPASHVLRIWDFESRTERRKFSIPATIDGEPWDFHYATVSEDGAFCALALKSSRSDETRWQLQCFNLSTRELLWTQSLRHRPAALEFSKNALRLAVTSSDKGDLMLLNAVDGRPLWQQFFTPGQSETTAFSPDGVWLAVAGQGSTIFIINAATGEHFNRLRGDGAGITSLTWAPSGLVLISASKTGNIRSWESPLQPNRRLTELLTRFLKEMI